MKITNRAVPCLCMLTACIALAAQSPSTWGMPAWRNAVPWPLPTGPVRVQKVNVEGSGVASVRATFAASNKQGNLIVAFVRMSTTSQTVELADSVGDIYSQAVAQSQIADGSQIHIFYARAKGGLNAVTARFSALNNHPWLAIYEYSGVGILDQRTSAQGYGALPKTSSLPAFANELVFVGEGMPATFIGATAAGSGFALSQQDTGHSRAAIETSRITTAGTAAGVFTLSYSVNWAIAVATFK